MLEFDNVVDALGGGIALGKNGVRIFILPM